MTRFDGKTVLVTGGAQGIARATAEAFGSEGANVVLFDIEEDTLERTARELSDKGWPVEAVVGDVSRREDVRGAVDRAVGRFGRLDVLFAAAAVTEIRPLLDVTDEVWDRIISVNLPTVPSASSGPSPGLHTGAGREPGAADCPACVPRVRQSVPWRSSAASCRNNTRASAGLEGGRRRAAIPRPGCQHLRYLVPRLASNLRLTRRRRVQRWHRTSRSSIS